MRSPSKTDAPPAGSIWLIAGGLALAACALVWWLFSQPDGSVNCLGECDEVAPLANTGPLVLVGVAAFAILLGVILHAGRRG